MINFDRFFARFMPYVAIGFMLVLFVLGLAFFSYLFLIAFVIGAILYAIAYIRVKFFSPKIKQTTQKHKGRVIEHDENLRD